MTVKELRSILAQCPDDAVVVFDTLEFGLWGVTDKVSETIAYGKENYTLSYSRVPWAQHVTPINVVILNP